MSFSPEWLALREPVDHRSVNRDVAAAVRAHFDGPDHVTVMDLGCGAGSNLRGSYALLPDSQHWTLVDFDPVLLEAARDRLIDWADEASEAGEELMLAKGDKRLMVDFRQVDLARDLEKALDWRPDLVTAAALFDLVSAPWLEGFVREMTARGLPLYTVLTYDGREDWRPAHPADKAVLAAFNAHQTTDKGFGASAGPEAARLMATLFGKAGYRIASGDSPWVLEEADRALAAELAEGVANAARETGRVPADQLDAWRSARAASPRAVIGHLDIFARRP